MTSIIFSLFWWNLCITVTSQKSNISDQCVMAEKWPTNKNSPLFTFILAKMWTLVAVQKSFQEIKILDSKFYISLEFLSTGFVYKRLLMIQFDTLNQPCTKANKETRGLWGENKKPFWLDAKHVFNVFFPDTYFLITLMIWVVTSTGTFWDK